jgi:hypothetical protein
LNVIIWSLVVETRAIDTQIILQKFFVTPSIH